MKGETLLPSLKKRIVREYYEQLHAKDLDNLVEVNKFLERHTLLKQTQQEIESEGFPWWHSG